MHLTDWTCSDCEGLVQRGRGWGLQDCEGFWALGSEVRDLETAETVVAASPVIVVASSCRPRPRRRRRASSSPRRRIIVAASAPLPPYALPELAVARRGRRVSSSPHCFGRCRNVVASSSPRPVPIVASSSQPHRRRRRQPVRRNRRAAPPVTPRRPNQHEHAWARTAA